MDNLVGRTTIFGSIGAVLKIKNNFNTVPKCN